MTLACHHSKDSHPTSIANTCLDWASVEVAMVAVVARRTNTNSSLKDCKSVNKRLAAEHRCRTDFVLKHNGTETIESPSKGKEYFDTRRDFCKRPSFDCVHVQYGMQDMAVVEGSEQPWRPVLSPVLHPGTLAG